MALRALGNPIAGFIDYLSRTGTDAVNPAPSGITATGGTKTTSGSYTIHTFTASGSLVVSAGSGDLEYLVVAGGGGGGDGVGGGGSGAGGSGGGAGGLLSNHPDIPAPTRQSSFSVSSGTYTIQVGGGGNAQTQGTPSFITRTGISSVTSIGGGGGVTGGSGTNGNPGGSGSGGFSSGGSGSNYPGANQQGFPGGTGGGNANVEGLGGGGGAGVVGSNAQAGPGGAGFMGGGNGGNGIPVSIDGTAYWYSGGGGGSAYAADFNPSYGSRGVGGKGGGGGASTKYNPSIGGTPGPARNETSDRNGASNTGGGGAGGWGSGGAGGSGIVIVRYLT